MKERLFSFVKKYKKIEMTFFGILLVGVFLWVCFLLRSGHVDKPVESSTPVANQKEVQWLLENYATSYRDGLITEAQYKKIVQVLENCSDGTLILDGPLEEILASIAADDDFDISVAATVLEPSKNNSEDSTNSTQELTSSSQEETTTEEQTTEEDTTEPPTEPPTEPDPRESVLLNYTNLAVVTAPNYLNVREGPSKKYKVIGKLIRNSGVDLLEQSADGQWYHVVSNEVDGWINAGYLAGGEEARQLAIENAFPGIRVTARLLNVRSGPSMDYEIITQVNRGAILVVLGIEGEWIKVDLGSEEEGYVHGDYIKWNYMLQGAVPYEEPVKINPLRLELINFAMDYLGGRYVWGGTTLGKGVDCSGFTLRVFEHFGYQLERTAASQGKYNGVEVAFSDMQPGDLIFFWSSKRNCVGHVGIYIGNGMMVHAASETRGIVIDPYDYMTPLFAKNIIGD